MAYASGVQGGYGASGPVIHHESSDHSVLVPDTELLFTAQFHRAGPDLILTGHDGQHHLIPGYFASEHHPALVAPNGARLSPAVVDLLAGSPTPGHYAQAQPTAPPDAIGKVEKVVGDVTVMRNGVAVALHVGDAVFKSDVVQTGSQSMAGIGFPDGTALNLVANTRMALNEYSYDPNGQSNGALFSLVEGTFQFVAGKVAHVGDMKIATPMATMGIRGTTGFVEQHVGSVTSNQGNVNYFSYGLVNDHNTDSHGAYDLFVLNPDGTTTQFTVSDIRVEWDIIPGAPGQPPQILAVPLTSARIDALKKSFEDFFDSHYQGPQSTGDHGSSTPPPYEVPQLPQLFLEPNLTPVTLNSTVTDGPGGLGGGSPTEVIIPPPPPSPPSPPPLPSDTAIWISPFSGDWIMASDWDINSVPDVSKLVEILTQVTVTISDPEAAGGLELAAVAVLEIVAGGSLAISGTIDNAGLIELNSSGSDPTLAIDGTVFLQGGGEFKMLGLTAENMIIGVANSGATLVNLDNTITGSGTIGGGDGNLTLENFGIIDATGEIVVNTGNEVINAGLMEATNGATLVLDDSIANSGGMIAAIGTGSVVELKAATIFGGKLEISSGGLVELAGATIDGTTVTDDGTIHVTADSTIDGNAVVDGDVGVLTVDGGVTLTLDDATLENLNVTNNGTLQVDTNDKLTLSQVSIAGGTITDDRQHRRDRGQHAERRGEPGRRGADGRERRDADAGWRHH